MRPDHQRRCFKRWIFPLRAGRVPLTAKVPSRATPDGPALGAMQDGAEFALARMPAVKPTVAGLIVSPDEVLNRNAG